MNSIMRKPSSETHVIKTADLTFSTDLNLSIFVAPRPNTYHLFLSPSMISMSNNYNEKKVATTDLPLLTMVIMLFEHMRR